MKRDIHFQLRAHLTKTMTVSVTQRPWNELERYIKKNKPSHVICVIDDIVIGKFSLPSFISKDNIYIVKHGEQKKKLEQFEALLSFFYEKNIDKASLVIVVGGGMVTDLTGFASSVYYRGIPLVYMPTTLLSQVDAAIGGKNTINFHNTKNLIGTVYLPKKIIIDPHFTESLPEKEFSSGMAEIIKYAIGFDKTLFPILETMEDSKTTLFDLIKRCVEIKIRFVEKDLYEEGKKRKLLNLGHTVGQALESQHGYALSHGHAVSIGLLFSLYISLQKGFISQKDFHRIVRIFRKYDLPPKIIFSIEETMRKMRYDKKSHGDGIDFILIPQLGKSYICKISFEDIQSFLEKFQSFYYSL